MDLFNELGVFLANVAEQATYFGLIGRINLLEQQGQFDEAIELTKQSLDLARKIWGNEHKHSARKLNSHALHYLARLYNSQGKYSLAEPLAKEALGMCKRLYQGDHPDVATMLNSLASSYYQQGKNSLAEPLLKEALAMRKRLFTGDHSDLATSLNNLASLYDKQGKYTKAEPLYQEALAMNKRLFTRDHHNVANGLSSLACLYNKQGKYTKAEPLHQEALAMIKRLFTKDHPDVATSLNNLASLYDKQGKYTKAEPLYQEALAMKKRLFTRDHHNVANVAHTLHNLAILYKNQGKYTKAEPLLQEALAMIKRLFTEDHPDVATMLNSLAALYYNQGKYTKVEPLLQEALAIIKRLFTEDHPDVATMLNNLAVLYVLQEKYTKAEPLYQEALAMNKRLFTENHPDVANILNNLASLYHNQGKYTKVEPLLQEALAMHESLFPNGHFFVVLSLNNLASLYAITNRHQEALKFFKEATEVEHRLMSQEFLGSSENDRMLFLDKIRTTQYNLLCLVYKYFYPLEESPEKSDAIYTALNLVLKRKAISNAADAAFNAAMNSDRYPHLQDSFETYRSLWKQIVNLQSSLYLPENLSCLEPNKKFLNELYIEVETLQKKLSAEVPEMNLKNQLVDRQTIASELPENSTLIEFAYFSVYDFTTKKSQNYRYLAFILPAKQPEKVQMIDLGEAGKIDNLISLVCQAISPVNLENMALVTKKIKLGTSKPSNPFIELTTTVFQPLQKYLEGEKLFICPDGKFTLIPFEILPIDIENNRLFIDKYQITYLTAARDLLRYKNQPTRTATESLVIADPNFDLSVEIPPIPISQGGGEISPIPLIHGDLSINLNSLKSEIIQTFGQEDKERFSPVPMTREIAQGIAAEFQVKPLLQNDALKIHFTNGKCPKKLVLATHGFFLEQENIPFKQDDPPQLRFERGAFMEIGFPLRQIKTEKNPLWRSGLALAGANTWLFGGEIIPEAESGILFALDVAGLDLWANELIILIACETAVGDVKIGEGVKGLRSAFTAAGARLLIMSLWSVPAQVSILLMNRFLANMQQKKLSSQQALQEAQIYVKKITRTELEALPTGQKIIQEIRASFPKNYPELLKQWEAQNYPLQARYFWGAWVCVGREF